MSSARSGRGLAAALAASLAALCLGDFDAAAASDSTPDADPRIDEIVVVAHKDQRSIRDIAANVTVVSREDTIAMLATSLTEIFQYTPGIDYESGGSRFGAEGINIRGIGGNRVGILLDGVPLGDQFAVGSFSNATRNFLDAGLVERIEVLHGPGSALYGSAAIGGVVAARTPDPADFLRDGCCGGNLLATWRSSDESAHGTGLFAVGRPDHGVVLGASVRDGQQADSAAVGEEVNLRDYERRSLLAKYLAADPLGNTVRVGLIQQRSNVKSDFNSMLGSGRYRSTTALRGDDSFDLDLLSAAYEFGSPESRFGGGTVRSYWESVDIAQATLDERAAAATPVSIDRHFAFAQKILGAELNLQKEVSSGNLGHRLGFGLEFRQRDTAEVRDGLQTNLDTGATTSVLLGEVFPLRDFPVSRTTEWGAYVEDVIEAGDWTLIGAVRLDHYDLQPKADVLFEQDYPFVNTVSVTDSDISPKLGVIYRFSASADIFAQYAHGFRAPPFEDANIGLEIPAFNYRAIPNPDLKSETSDGVDIGIRWSGMRSDVSVTLFRTHYDDFIASKLRVGIDETSGRVLFQSQNLREARIEGVEASASVGLWGALENVSLHASLYKARSEDRDSGEPLNSVGPGQLTAGAGWQSADERSRLRLQWTLTERWDARDNAAGELYEPPGHGVVDLYFSRAFGRGVTLRVGALNLTDEVYWHWADIRGLSADDSLIAHLARPGRSVSASLNISWR